MDPTIERNVRSIDEAPLDVLPLGLLRDELRWAAASGADCYIYKAAGSTGPWNLWYWGMRIPLAEYVARYAREGAVK